MKPEAEYIFCDGCAREVPAAHIAIRHKSGENCCLRCVNEPHGRHARQMGQMPNRMMEANELDTRTADQRMKDAQKFCGMHIEKMEAGR